MSGGILLKGSMLGGMMSTTGRNWASVPILKSFLIQSLQLRLVIAVGPSTLSTLDYSGES